MSKAADIPDSVMEDAIGWFDDLRADTQADNEAFTGWLMRSPTHVEAFLSIAALHGGLAAASDERKQWLESLLATARSNVLPLDNSRGTQQAERRSHDGIARQSWPGIALAATVTVALLAGLVFGIRGLQSPGEVARYTTAVGEQRTLVLEDGSLLQLNTNTSVTVRFSEGLRDIVLLSGEAMFKVRKDPARPFRVHSGKVWVQAIGTRFNVYRKTDETEVTVIEGRVAVDSRDTRAQVNSSNDASEPANAATDTVASPGDKSAVELTAGEQIAIRRDGSLAEVATSVDTEKAIAWTLRRVVFDNDTLDTVAAEFNRYNRDKLVIADSALQQRRISGVFTVNDPQSFAEVLASMTPIRFEKRTDGSVKIVSAEAAEASDQR
jgi:transmembrane sensor